MSESFYFGLGILFKNKAAVKNTRIDLLSGIQPKKTTTNIIGKILSQIVLGLHYHLEN